MKKEGRPKQQVTNHYGTVSHAEMCRRLPSLTGKMKPDITQLHQHVYPKVGPEAVWCSPQESAVCSQERGKQSVRG